MARRTTTALKTLKIRLYPGLDNDLIAWVEQFDDQPYGVKSQSIKNTLRQGIRESTDQAMETESVLDLSEIRRVIEASVASAMSRFEGQLAVAAITGNREDDETEDLLDALGSALILDE